MARLKRKNVSKLKFKSKIRRKTKELKHKKLNSKKPDKSKKDSKTKILSLLFEEDEDIVDAVESDLDDVHIVAPILDAQNKIELDNIVVNEDEVFDNSKTEPSSRKDQSNGMLEQIMFRVPCVPDPLIGTPKQIQNELDTLVIKMQKVNSDKIFDKIHLYMHGYLIHVVLRKFPFIRGYQTVDIYQETLIALRFKAIPNFELNKGMSFLNFAKMCIRRHLITLLNTSKNRKKDQAMNQSISLDSTPFNDDDNKSTLANILPDKSTSVSKNFENDEAYNITKKYLLDNLSDFEQVVMNEYLTSSSYKEISKNVSTKLGKRYNTKSIDNALLRIRKKAIQLRENGKIDDTPLFFDQK